MKNKTLYIISGIICLLFLIVFFTLFGMGNIKLSALITFVIIVIILVSIVDILYWYVNKTKTDIVTNDKNIDKSEAKLLAIEMLNNNYFENVDEIDYEDVLEMGTKNTPIYVLVVRGEFEKKLYGIVINMKDTTRSGIKKYSDTQIKIEDIKADVLDRANSCAFSPKAAQQFKEMQTIDPFSGKLVQIKEPKEEKEIDKQQDKGVSLQ
jgi:hypothetical protein